MEILIASAVVGLWPGFVARKKGRSFWGFYFLSFLVTPMVSLLIIYCLKEKPKKCNKTEADMIRAYNEHINNAINAGGNFGFIAQNVATIYCALDHIKFGQSLSKYQKIYATALLDAFTYLKEKSLTVDDIKDCVLRGCSRDVSLNSYTSSYFNMNIGYEYVDLRGMTMQLEALIFQADTDIDSHDIVDAVIQNCDVISKMIMLTINQGENSPLYKNVLRNIQVFLTDEDIVNEIKAYQTDEKNPDNM